MSEQTNFYLNGQKYATVQLISLFDLLDYFDYKSVLFVLEYNHYICDKTEWPKIRIKNNDKIEIITIVGGG